MTTVDCIVPIKSLDLARNLYYKQHPNEGYSTLSHEFRQHLRNEHSIVAIIPIIEDDIWVKTYKIKFVDEAGATFFLLKFS
jgi:hypothetical protein